ncbi:hypothetical protein [Streptomyces sp. SP18BB07]|uniref:hypothetical protein n=1 Tax=Streptomyces sp. SP18BB07 TaxID=3002522 RepID=UPI002E773BB7|nr:hypothetical protein [Streptomyces sp. SP18BB07]MEE1757623.1 hypothetical protein [Streptomyces sp. SP18BB07]
MKEQESEPASSPETHDDAITRADQGFGMASLGSDIGLLIRQIESMNEALRRNTVAHRWF